MCAAVQRHLDLRVGEELSVWRVRQLVKGRQINNQEGDSLSKTWSDTELEDKSLVYML
jgi:hypothetical protein